MNIGHFAFPVAPLVLFLSIGIALVVAHFMSHGANEAETSILYSVAAGLVVSRLSFVGHYLPAYRGDVLKMLDFRDLGFDMKVGVVAGGIVLLLFLFRRRHVRRAVLISALAGCASWGVATAFAGAHEDDAFVPEVNVVDMEGRAQPLARHDGAVPYG